MGRIVSMEDISKIVAPYTATVVSGAWDIFHIGHLRYLKKCSQYSKPFIVGVMSDRVARALKGPNRPIMNEMDRAEIIASLSFVDYVVIFDNPPYDEKYVSKILPKNLIFCKENMQRRSEREKFITDKYKGVKFIFLDKQSKSISTTEIIKKLKDPFDFEKIKDPIEKDLLAIAEKSTVSLGKVGALIIENNKIVAQSENTDEAHAEENVIRVAKQKINSLNDCKIFITIPPCVNCAKKIVEEGIKEVYYLLEYGIGDGTDYLKNHNVKINKYEADKVLV